MPPKNLGTLMQTILGFITHSILVIVVYEDTLQKVTNLFILYQTKTFIDRFDTKRQSTISKYFDIFLEHLC